MSKLSFPVIFVFVLLIAGASGALLASHVAKSVDENLDADALRSFVTARGGNFYVGGRPFKFVGANAAVMYRDEDRAQMPETLRVASESGIKVVRVWASGEGGEDSPVKALSDQRDWSRKHPFRFRPDDWNEEQFVHLDKVLAEAAKDNLRVQLCLANWWRDTGGVTQYLYWAGIKDAADDREPFGINVERAMLFYTDAETRRMYRQHLEKILTRRNTVTGKLYRDDPTIFAYELMNEAQAPSGRWEERRRWVAEMSAYAKSLDPNHLITPGTWGYRNAIERRAWLEDHKLSAIDFCDVHLYPRDDLDSYVDSPAALREFIDNRVAAAYSIHKPLVIGEFGMSPDGYKSLSEADWFRSYFQLAAERGANAAMFWIITPDEQRGYGVTYSTPRDAEIFRAIRDGAQALDAASLQTPPEELRVAEHHLAPRQFVFTRSANDPMTQPQTAKTNDGGVIYKFEGDAVREARFEKLGGGRGYLWGDGIGFFEYVLPPFDDKARPSEIIVRAHLQPVPPWDGRGRIAQSRVTLLLNEKNCGSRLIAPDTPLGVSLQEWRISPSTLRRIISAAQPLRLKFAVLPDADMPYGLNISGFPEGFNAQNAAPVEVEVR